MDPSNPGDAQQIVSQYMTLLERHAEADRYPVSVETLPHGKEILKVAIRTSIATLRSLGQLTNEMRDFFEIAYVSLADYVDAELAALMVEYNDAAGGLATDSRPAREKVTTGNWETLARSGRLAGQIARSIAKETEVLREQFRAFAND